jgi:hypothetical protein
MERLVIALIIAAAAVVLALILARRRPDAPTTPAYTVPAQLDRVDFDRPDANWLVAVFTSTSCETCASTLQKARPLASDSVVVQDVEVHRDERLHQRYQIDAVPTVVVADCHGVVQASFLGPITATDLWATVAELRDPGSADDGEHRGQPSAP